MTHWLYTQLEGMLTLNGVGKGLGYSGKGAGCNNPAAQTEPNVGPIPVGKYFVGKPQDTVTHGPFVLPLTPDPSNRMFGRSGFLVHGDSVISPGTRSASEGCIVLDRSTREKIARSGVNVLYVAASYLDAVKEDDTK